jgi:hypothetical protein
VGDRLKGDRQGAKNAKVGENNLRDSHRPEKHLILPSESVCIGVRPWRGFFFSSDLGFLGALAVAFLLTRSAARIPPLHPGGI